MVSLEPGVRKKSGGLRETEQRASSPACSCSQLALPPPAQLAPRMGQQDLASEPVSHHGRPLHPLATWPKHNVRKRKATALSELLLGGGGGGVCVPGLCCASACAWTPRRRVLSGTGMAGIMPARTCHGHVLACVVQQRRYSVQKLEISPRHSIIDRLYKILKEKKPKTNFPPTQPPPKP